MTLLFTSAQPKIITDDGNIKFQSAANRNISFEIDDNSDVNFGDTSIREIKKSVSFFAYLLRG